MKAAFLIIDMQKKFVNDSQKYFPELKHVADHIDHVASFFRKRSLPVIFIYDEESCKPGDPEFEFTDLIVKQETDKTILKMHGNSFKETELENIIKSMGIDFILISGFKAEACVLSTIHGAIDRNISFAVLRDGILSTSEDGAAFVEKNYPIISYSVVEALI